MRCPVIGCGQELVKIDSKRYETIVEHVMEPNCEPSMKDGYMCPNCSCVAFMKNFRWIEDGEFYGIPYGVSFVGGIYSPIDSSYREIEEEVVNPTTPRLGDLEVINGDC